MKYLKISEFALQRGVSVRRVQQMCKNGDIPGAVKKGRAWMIPVNEDVEGVEKKKPLPIGISDFKVATTEYYYVDKTLLIKDFLDKRPMVSLFTRPRRFGKTLNMDMFRVFFEKTEQDNSVYFQDKLIWQCGEEYRAYQGKYPVIFMSFKDIKFNSWHETFDVIKKVISAEFLRHKELIESNKCNNYDKEFFKSVIERKLDAHLLASAFEVLSKMLHEHYEIAPIIIIDEYDIPIQQGYMHGYYNEIIMFMRNLFSGGLKDNRHLSYGFLTGILRVAKESIFSGLNNLKINSILDDRYSEYFGFTKQEVKEMLDYYCVGNKLNEVCDWYDGYRFGNNEIFNPWSVINYIDTGCFPRAFWQATGSNDIVGAMMELASPEIVEGLYKILSGQSITAYIDTDVIYPEIKNNAQSIYSFLLVAGYLRVSAIYPQYDGNFMCDIQIPNKEIAVVYEKEVLNKINQNNMAIDIAQAIFSGNVDKLQSCLDKFMLETISSLDGANEGFYHGMMIGLCAVLSNRYQVRSNRESGMGRFDVMLIPRVKNMPGFIYEFKFVKDENINLNELADSALEQIDNKQYEIELKDFGINDVIKIGIAFRGKNAVVKKRE